MRSWRAIVGWAGSHAGRQIDVEAIGILRIVDGRLVERWNVTDVFSLLQQIGGLPNAITD